MVDIQKTIVGRLNARFHLPENADFTLWVCVVQATCPRPDRWPTVYAAIAEKCMVTKQHKSPAVTLNCFQINFVETREEKQ